MNKEEFEQLEKSLESDDSADITGAAWEEGQDVRYFGISTRFFDVPGYLNSLDSLGWMAPEGYQPGEARDSIPRLRLIGQAVIIREYGGGTTHIMTFEDLNTRSSKS